MPKERDIVKMIWTNFKNSIIRPRPKGNLVGKDVHGNSYFEIPADRRLGRKPSRWFEPSKKDMFDAKMPSEWEAWLRSRRDTAPSIDELTRNVGIMKQTQDNALIKGYTARDKETDPNKTASFPKYDDLEVFPGETEDKHHRGK